MKVLSRGDVNGLAHRLFGYGICRHCVNMLCRAIEGRGEYAVPRCPRCGLAVDSRKVEAWQRTDMINSKRIRVALYKQRRASAER